MIEIKQIISDKFHPWIYLKSLKEQNPNAIFISTYSLPFTHYYIVKKAIFDETFEEWLNTISNHEIIIFIDEPEDKNLDIIEKFKTIDINGYLIFNN